MGSYLLFHYTVILWAVNEDWIRKTVTFLLIVQVAIVLLDVVFNFLAIVDDEDFREIFNMARELSISNWFSSMLEAGTGLVFWLIHLQAKDGTAGRRAARGWAIAAVLFFYIGLDDGTQMHERVSTAAASYFAVTSESGGTHPGALGWIGALLDRFPSYPWQILFGPVLAGTGLYTLWFLWRKMERKEARTACLGFFLYGIAQGQDFIEGLETPYGWLTARLGTGEYTVPHFAKVGEESVEMIGTILVLWAALHHYSAHARRQRG